MTLIYSKHNFFSSLVFRWLIVRNIIQNLLISDSKHLLPWSHGDLPWSRGSSLWSCRGPPWVHGGPPWSHGGPPWSRGGSPWSLGGSPLTLEALRHTLEPWRLTLEPWRFTLEPSRFRYNLGGLPMSHSDSFVLPGSPVAVGVNPGAVKANP